MSGIVGRDAELRAGEDLLRRVRVGRAALLVEGPAGIGKTTIWSAIAERASAHGMRVLTSRPAAAEASLTLSALADLLDPLPSETFAELPLPQRRAVDAALLRDEPGDEPPGDRLLGTAVRSALERLALEEPVILALDDLQWMDAASAGCLAYALRRLPSARIGILAARRSGLEPPVSIDALAGEAPVARVTVGPLTVAALHHVVKERLGSSPARSTLVRIHEAAEGNPLVAIEIASALAEAGSVTGQGPLPVPVDVRTLVAQRLQRLPDDARDTLLVASALGRPDVGMLATTMARDVATDLATAAAEGIARSEDGRVTFGHPLFAAGVYRLAEPAARRHAHARIADVSRDPEERARHRALAVDGPDESLARELEAAAGLAARRGAPAAAADLMELALERTEAAPATPRLERSIALGTYLHRAGDARRARGVFDRVLEQAPRGPLRARAGIAAAALAFDADVGLSPSRLAEAAVADAALDPLDPLVLAHAHAVAASVVYDDRRRAIDHAKEGWRLIQTVPEADPRIEGLVLGVYIRGVVESGEPIPWADVERALQLERDAPPSNVGDRFSASLGPLLRTRDDFEGARRWMNETYQAAIDEGDEGSLPYALSHLPTLELAVGNWTRAAEIAAEHLELARATGLDAQLTQALFNVGLVHAQLGHEPEARAALDELMRLVTVLGSEYELSLALGAVGALELSRDDVPAAARALARAEGLRKATGDERPTRYGADVVEALVAAGDAARAEVAAASIVARARAAGLHSALALAARAEAIVAGARGDLDGAAASLDEALRHHEAVPVPYERARTKLVLGRVLRRTRRRTDAKAAFEAALAEFEALGARLWAERARAELDRIGLRRATPDALTEGERRVADLVATGLTNREVAAALYVSPKTVEANLARAYSKLGVRSRAELGARLGGASRGDVARPRPDDGRAAKAQT